MFRISQIGRSAFSPFAFAALVLTAAAADTAAQTVGAAPGFGLRGTLGYYILGGDDFEGTDNGPGFGASFHHTFPAGFSLIGTFQYNSHGIDGNDKGWSIISIAAEPRYYFRIPTAPTLSPFVGGRLSWLHESTEVSDPQFGTFDVSGNGWTFGISGGLLVQFSRQVAFESGLNISAISIGDLSVDGDQVPDTDSSGSTVGIFAGIVVSFPPR